MQITHMTYARVAQHAVPAPMVDRPRDPGVDAFLIDHIHALTGMATTGKSPCAHFTNPDAKTEFDKLRNGTDQQFLDAAGWLTSQLIAEMDGRTKPGLLVCLRVEDDSKLSAAALKLQVVTPNAAVLEALDSGEEVLAAAKNVLEAPGDLQKGALVDDPRDPDSEVIIGDALTNDALYFPRAFGIRTEQRAKDGGADLLNTLSSQLDAATVATVAAALPSYPPGSPTQVLDAASNDVPELTPDVRDATVAALRAQNRPVTNISTDAPLKQTVTADGIMITGSVTSMQAVDITERPGGGYRITIDVSEQPQRRYKR